MSSSYYKRANDALVRFEQTAKDLKILGDLQAFFASKPGLSPYTKANYMNNVISLTKFTKKPLRKITASDISEWVNTGQGETPSTRIKTIKPFLRWLYKGKLHEDIEKLRITSKKRLHRIENDDLPTVEEIRQIRSQARSLRDKALIMALYGTGARITALLNMRVKDVVEQNGVTRLRVSGKEGVTDYLLKPEALPWLKRWLATFSKDDADNPLWPNTHDPSKPLGYDGLHVMLQRFAKEAGIKKRINPHIFRHRRNTELYRKVGPAKAKLIQGYTKSSMILEERYTHLVDGDRVAAFLESEGLEAPKAPELEQLEEQPESIICPRCELTNDGRFFFCGRCGQPLSDSALAQVITEREEDALLAEVLKDPKVRSEMAETLKEIMKKKKKS